MGQKLIPLSFRASTDLPEKDDLSTFLETEFWRQVPGFSVIEADARWGECRLDLVGKDGTGALVLVFPSVSLQERDYHSVVASALIAATWLEENRAEAASAYADKSVDLERPLRMIVVAPGSAPISRALSKALDRAGLEVMRYSISELDTSEGNLHAVTFEDAPPAPQRSSRPEPRETAAPAPPKPAPPVVEASEAQHARVERTVEVPARVEPTLRPAVEPVPEPFAEPREAPAAKAASPVEQFIASLGDQNLKTMSEQIFAFLVARFPAAVGVVSPHERGFTLHVGDEHLATVRLDKGAVWLEVGPEKIPTNKIKDPTTLDRAMHLPSVLEALHGVHAA